MRPFASLTAVMRAVVTRDARALEQLLRDVDPASFESIAVRHKCAGLIRAAIDDFRLRAPSPLAGLRRYAAFAMTDNMALVEQATQASAILARAGIDHAILKGAARLIDGNRGAFCTHHFDLDVLVRERDAQQAYAAAVDAGYRPQYDAARVAWYRRHHHHLAPLEIAGGKPLELHVALAAPGTMAFPTSWEALEPHLERDSERPQVFTLDVVAQALHLLAHGIDGKRLHDAVLLATLLRDNKDLDARLCGALGPATESLGIAAMRATALELCGIRIWAPRLVQQYRDWMARREDLPAALRQRSQLIDAWYLNGGSLRGDATTAALATTPARALGRAATSLAAATLASLL